MKMLHCLDSPEMTVLERQRTRLKWHQQDTFFNGGGTGGVNFTSFLTTAGNLMGLGEVVDVPPSSMVKPDPTSRIDQGWGQFGSSFSASSSGFEMNLNGTISRTASCPLTVAAAAAMVAKAGADLASLPERKSFKKRKPESAALTKQDEEEETKDKKKVKGSNEEMESKITAQSNNNNNNNVGSKTKNKKETSASTSKDNSKASDVQKPDFIHVRARRGQATDSHSLAERVRREKISERMKFLQDLVPGCNRITGKAGMLDEIINYVQSLQRQVEFLSMKLATVNPRLDFDVDNFLAKDMIPNNGSIPFPAIDMAPDMSNPFHFNPLQHPISGLEMGLNLDMGLRRTTSAPVSIPETFIDSYPQLQLPSPWDNDLLSLYNLEFHQERATSFSSQQQFADGVEASNLKMEM